MLMSNNGVNVMTMRFWLLPLLLFSNVASTENSLDSQGVKSVDQQFTEHYVMLYYKDITAASHFYGSVLSMPTAMDEEWVKLFQVLPGSFIGVVKEGEGAYHKAKKNNAVMVSLVTEDVDTLYESIKSKKNITILKELYDNKSVPIRVFLLADPGGYTIEIFQWLN